MKKLLLLICLISFFSCNSNKKNEGGLVKLPYTVFLEDEDLRNPYKMSVTDKYLILTNLKTDTVIDVYSLKGEKLSQFLLHGEGPNEVLNVVSLQYLERNNALHIIDNFRTKTYSVNLNEIENGDNVEIHEEQTGLDKLEDKLAVKDWWKFLKNGKLLASSATSKGMLSYYDVKTNEMTFFEKYPDSKDINGSLNESATIGLFQSECSVTPESDKAAVVYYTSDIIGFVTLENGELNTKFIRSQLPNDIFPIQFEDGTVRGAFTKKSLRHYVTVTANKKNVYALYCGLSEGECMPGLMRGKFVRCYDWNGDLLHTISLDFDVLQIAVSPDNEYLYALESSEDGFRVLKYEL